MPAAAVVFVVDRGRHRGAGRDSPGARDRRRDPRASSRTTLFTGMVVELVADVQDGRRDATAGQLLQAATPVLGQLILVGHRRGHRDRDRLRPADRPRADPDHDLVGRGAGRRARAPAAASRALGRSRELVRGNGWQVFGVILVLVHRRGHRRRDHRGDRRLRRNRRRHRRAGSSSRSSPRPSRRSRPRCSTSSCAAPPAGGETSGRPHPRPYRRHLRRPPAIA